MAGSAADAGTFVSQHHDTLNTAGGVSRDGERDTFLTQRSSGAEADTFIVPPTPPAASSGSQPPATSSNQQSLATSGTIRRCAWPASGGAGFRLLCTQRAPAPCCRLPCLQLQHCSGQVAGVNSVTPHRAQRASQRWQRWSGPAPLAAAVQRPASRAPHWQRQLWQGKRWCGGVVAARPPASLRGLCSLTLPAFAMPPLCPQVYLGSWRHIEVACKVLSSSGGGDFTAATSSAAELQLSKQVAAKLEDEARLLATLRHPNILYFRERWWRRGQGEGAEKAGANSCRRRQAPPLPLLSASRSSTSTDSGRVPGATLPGHRVLPARQPHRRAG